MLVELGRNRQQNPAAEEEENRADSVHKRPREAGPKIGMKTVSHGRLPVKIAHPSGGSRFSKAEYHMFWLLHHKNS